MGQDPRGCGEWGEGRMMFSDLFSSSFLILYVNCFGRTVLYMCIEYHI